jgi:hypothetical protein
LAEECEGSRDCYRSPYTLATQCVALFSHHVGLLNGAKTNSPMQPG